MLNISGRMDGSFGGDKGNLKRGPLGIKNKTIASHTNNVFSKVLNRLQRSVKSAEMKSIRSTVSSKCSSDVANKPFSLFLDVTRSSHSSDPYAIRNLSIRNKSVISALYPSRNYVRTCPECGEGFTPEQLQFDYPRHLQGHYDTRQRAKRSSLSSREWYHAIGKWHHDHEIVRRRGS